VTLRDAGRRVWLMTTPLHLRAFHAGLAPRLRSTASSFPTMPLAVDLARDVERDWRVAVSEIYGCTEGGMLAVRRPAHDERFMPGAGLAFELDREGRARVSGGQLDASLALSDRFRREGEGLVLVGRSSEFVKIAGKRTTLAALTAALQSIPGVLDGAFLMSDPDATRLAALAVAPGHDAASLRAALAARVDRAFLPRPLAFVAALPRDPQGKLPPPPPRSPRAGAPGGRGARPDRVLVKGTSAYRHAIRRCPGISRTAARARRRVARPRRAPAARARRGDRGADGSEVPARAVQPDETLRLRIESPTARAAASASRRAALPPRPGRCDGAARARLRRTRDEHAGEPAVARPEGARQHVPDGRHHAHSRSSSASRRRRAALPDLRLFRALLASRAPRVHGLSRARARTHAALARRVPPLSLFATTILDRVFLYAGRMAGSAPRGRRRGAARDRGAGRGCLLFGAHFGSFDVLRAIAVSDCPCRSACSCTIATRRSSRACSTGSTPRFRRR
jgi:hypothetical protein